MTTLQEIEFATADGGTATLAHYSGRVVLVVNVASSCGLTPQYEALEQLYAAKRDAGLTVLGFPCNDFGGQEPGSDEDIQAFCSLEYEVTFPVLAKISVLGEQQHPLYRALTEAVPTAAGKEEMRATLAGHGRTPTQDPDVLWNFEKFVVGRDGRVRARFAPAVAPTAAAVVAAVDAALGEAPPAQ